MPVNSRFLSALFDFVAEPLACRPLPSRATAQYRRPLKSPPRRRPRRSNARGPERRPRNWIQNWLFCSAFPLTRRNYRQGSARRIRPAPNAIPSNTDLQMLGRAQRLPRSEARASDRWRPFACEIGRALVSNPLDFDAAKARSSSFVPKDPIPPQSAPHAAHAHHPDVGVHNVWTAILTTRPLSAVRQRRLCRAYAPPRLHGAVRLPRRWSATTNVGSLR